ncbi:MAG: M20/M25/M40 family metallo-hydrolase, partial [Pseudomonadota bacterium]|nr:M20/M25/M40 family metallo-hydrolase [Pseudomonadota bacterium]
ALARFNIRYNDNWRADTISSWIRARLDESAGDSGYELELEHTGDCFLTAPNSFVECLSTAVQSVTGNQPELSTSGGTSDARFIKDAARVVEFGLVGKTMHKVDERVRTDDIRKLAEIYRRLLDAYFS